MGRPHSIVVLCALTLLVGCTSNSIGPVEDKQSQSPSDEPTARSEPREGEVAYRVIENRFGIGTPTDNPMVRLWRQAGANGSGASPDLLRLSVIPSVSPHDLTEPELRRIADSAVEIYKSTSPVEVFFYDKSQAHEPSPAHTIQPQSVLNGEDLAGCGSPSKRFRSWPPSQRQWQDRFWSNRKRGRN